MKFKLIIALLLGCWSQTQAQIITLEVYPSGGDYFSQINGSLDWTMGEFMIDTYTNSTNYLTQGFHQGSEEAIIGIAEVYQNSVFKAYPNPTNGNVTIEFEGIAADNKNSVVQILDITGKVLKKVNWVGRSTIKLNLSENSAGFYLLRVIETGCQNQQLYKIQLIK